MKKVCANMVPKILSAGGRRRGKKKLRKKICSVLLKRIQNELDLLKSVITCDETLIFTYDLETK